MLEDLFTFPTIMVDGQNEEKKTEDKLRLGLPLEEEEEELDIVIGNAEYPYYDFVGIEDRWVPDKESFRKALKGKFNACLVKFTNVGHLLVPWTKSKFKEELATFIADREKEKETGEPKKVTIIKFTPDMLANLIKNADTTEQEDDAEE